MTLLKAGLVVMDPDTGRILRTIALQYNPESLKRSLEVQTTTEEGARSAPTRLRAAPVESIDLEAEVDATDRLAEGEVPLGIQPELAALETLLYPDSGRLRENDRLASRGVLEITPPEAPLVLFVWSKQRILPVRIKSFSVTEEAFDGALNPIRAKVSLGMRVLRVDDVGFSHRGGSLSLAHHAAKEALARGAGVGTVDRLGVGGVL